MGKTLTGSVDDIHKQLEELLTVVPHHDQVRADEGVSDYPTQYELFSDTESSSEEITVSDLIEFENLYLDDIVEVYWKGEHT